MSLALRSKRLKTSSATLHVLRDLVADAQVGERRRLRALGVVLDQRPRPEVAQLEVAEPRARGRARSRRARRRCRPSRGRSGPASVGSSVVKRARETRDVAVEQQPRRRDVVVVELDALPLARPARLGVAGVAGEDELGAELQLPERERASAGPGRSRCGCRARRPSSARAAATLRDGVRVGRIGGELLRLDRARSRRARRCCESRSRS